MIIWESILSKQAMHDLHSWKCFRFRDKKMWLNRAGWGKTYKRHFLWIIARWVFRCPYCCWYIVRIDVLSKLFIYVHARKWTERVVELLGSELGTLAPKTNLKMSLDILWNESYLAITLTETHYVFTAKSL